MAGAGIGGTTAAAALAHDGFEVVLLERASNLDHVAVGGGIHLWPNGQKALGYLDGRDQALRDELDADARLKRASFETFRGGRLVRWDTHATLSVLRGTLHRHLRDALPAGAVRTDSAVVRYEEHGDGVTVVLGGGETVDADALVAADGVRSTVRGQLLADGPPRYAGYSTWTAVVDTEHPTAPPGLFRILFGRGARFVYYHVGQSKVYWEATVALPEGGSDAPGGHRDALLPHFDDFAEPTTAFISATDESAIVRGDIYDRPPTKTWVSGRVALLGDAAHPMTNALGQGANQAMEDAIVLADSLKGAPELGAALLDYQRRRVPRANRMVTLSHRLAWMHMWRSRPAVAARTAMLRTVGPFAVNATRKDAMRDFLAT